MASEHTIGVYASPLLTLASDFVGVVLAFIADALTDPGLDQWLADIFFERQEAAVGRLRHAAPRGDDLPPVRAGA